MPPVRRHRIGDQLPAVIHPDPDPAAVAFCRDLAAETDAEAVVLFGSRATGGWDEQSDLDLIVVHPAADDDDDRRKAFGRDLADLRERHYPGHVEYDSPHHGVLDGLMLETPQNYHAGRRTLNHVIARAAREGRIFTRDPRDTDAFRHDGDDSNEWELVTAERLKGASEEAGDLSNVRRRWLERPRLSPARNAIPGRIAHGLLWNSGAALCPSWAWSTPGTRWRRRPSPSHSTTPAGATPSGATWTASTSTPAAGARWWSPTPSTTCRPCGGILRLTRLPCGNGSTN